MQQETVDELKEKIKTLQKQLDVIQTQADEVTQRVEEHDNKLARRMDVKDELSILGDRLGELQEDVLEFRYWTLKERTGGRWDADYSQGNQGAAGVDVFYSAQAMNRELQKELHYRLNLDSFSKELGEVHKPTGRRDTVSAEGTRKWSKNLFHGGELHIVLDERGMEP